MMATPHIFAGAAIGGVLHRRPCIALPAAFASHFALDAVPHLDSNDLFGSPTGMTVPEVGIAMADFALAWLLVALMTRSKPWRAMALWGALCAIGIDLVYTIPPWGPWLSEWPGTAWLEQFHHGIQPDVSPDNLLLGFGTQAAVIAAATWVLLRRQPASDL